MLILGFGGSNESGITTTIKNLSTISSFKWPLILAAFVFLGLFIWRQNKILHPLVDLSLFKLKNFMPASLSNFLVGFSLFIAIANVPIFINTLVATTVVQGAWDSGWMLSALTVPIALASVPGAWLSEKRGYRFAAAVGLILAVTGFMLMSTWRMATPYAVMIPQLIISGVGIGLTMAPIATAIVNTSPQDKRGTSSALVILFRIIGMTIGVSIITTFDIQRTRILSEQLLSAKPSLTDTVQVGMEVIEKVISETFIIAGFVAILALVAILFLKIAIKEMRWKMSDNLGVEQKDPSLNRPAAAPTPAAQSKKKSKIAWILGGCGCVTVLALLIMAVLALIFLPSFFGGDTTLAHIPKDALQYTSLDLLKNLIKRP